MSDSSRRHVLAKIADAITSRIIRDAESPYQQLMKKVNDIDINYFEDLPRDTEQLAPELNLELKEQVKNDFNCCRSPCWRTASSTPSIRRWRTSNPSSAMPPRKPL